MGESSRLKKKWIKMTIGKNINIYNGELNSIYITCDEMMVNVTGHIYSGK